VALRAILALPLRAMAAPMCGRDGSKPQAGSNQSKDCKLPRGAGFGQREQSVCLAVFRVVLAHELRAPHRSVPDNRTSPAMSRASHR